MATCPSQTHTQCQSEFGDPPLPLPLSASPEIMEKVETTLSPKTEAQDREDRHTSEIHLQDISVNIKSVNF